MCSLVCCLTACGPSHAMTVLVPLNSCIGVKSLADPCSGVCWHLLCRGTRSGNTAYVPVTKQTLLAPEG